MDAVTLYFHQAAAQRAIRDELLADLDEADLRWRPAPDMPSILWHAGHAAFTNAAAFCGQGAGDWSLLPPHLVTCFNVGASSEAALPAASEVMDLIRQWDAASDQRIRGLSPADLALALPQWQAEFLPDECRTWGGCLAYLMPHEAYHAGAIGVLRRLRGRPNLA